MSNLFISPKHISNYHFDWDDKAKEICVDIYDTFYKIRGTLAFNENDEKDDNILLKSIINIIKKRILNGETLFLYVKPIKKHDPFYQYSNFIMDRIIKFAHRLHKCNIVFLNPDDISDNDDTLTYSSNYKDINLSGSDKEIKNNIEAILENEIVNLDEYDEIVRIGDIQGCLSNLKKAFPDGIDKNKFYVFLGDYIDRGPDSLGVLKWVKKNCFKRGILKKNVVLIMGNHEQHLTRWSLGLKQTNASFIGTTLKQLKRNSHHKLINLFLSSLQSSFIYIYKGHTTICCHGGIENDLPKYPFNCINTDERDKAYWTVWKISGLRNMWMLSDRRLYGKFIDRESNINIGQKFVDNMIKLYAKDDRVVNLELVYGHFHVRGTKLSWENNEYNVRAICHENDVDRGGKLVVSYDYGDKFKIKQF